MKIMIHKLINFIIDIMFILLLFYFIDNEFIKKSVTELTTQNDSDNISPKGGNSNKVLLIFIILAVSCIFFPHFK